MTKQVQVASFLVRGPCCNNKASIPDNINKSITQGCGCSLKLKLRSLSSECPAHKWLALVSEQEEEMINNMVKKEDNNEV